MDGRNISIFPVTRPVIRQVRIPPGTGDSIVITGDSLMGADTVVMVGAAEIAPEYVSDNEVCVRLDPERISAGVQGLEVVHRWSSGSPPIVRPGIRSNSVPITIRPRITEIKVDREELSAGELQTVALILSVAPAVSPAQRVRLLLNEAGPSGRNAYIFSADGREGSVTTVRVQLGGIKSGEYLTRLEVDKAESLLEVCNGRYDAPKVMV